MRDYKYTFVYLTLILIFLEGCTVNRPMEITKVYPPLPNETLIELPRAELEAKCLETGTPEKCRGVKGLTIVSLFELGDTATIYLAQGLTPWDRACTLNHERGHGWIGDFHPGERHGGCQ